MSDARPFQVDLAGVVDLLSRHIYSSPRVYIRELLQNGVDAMTARREYAEENGLPTGDWGITIHPAANAEGEFRLTDEGMGLTTEEVSELLATVGRSSKKDILGMQRTDYLGQFGIGLLSCFMVCDEIHIVSRSATGANAVEWVGSSDGTFRVTELPDSDHPIGTTVSLRPRFDTVDLLTQPTVQQLATDYGEYLPVPIDVVRDDGTYRINHEPPFLTDADRATLDTYAASALGFSPLDTIDLSAPGTSTLGKAFVLPFAPPPNSRQSTRVYLGRMLLAPRLDEVLPDWTFFVRAVIDSTGLNPTASREGIVEDFNLEYTREQLGGCVRRWLVDLAVHQPHKLGGFLAIHESAIKQLVLVDEELASIFLGWLSVETTLGRMPLDKLVKLSPTVRYARTLDEFRQVASIISPETPLVNGGYVYDSELVELLPTVYPSVTVEKVDVLAELDRLDPPSLEDRDLTVSLEDRATAVLDDRDCQAVVRTIEQADVPGLYVADPEVFRHIDRRRASDAGGSSLWNLILAQTDAFAASRGPNQDNDFTSRLCLNWANPLIRSLATLDDEPVFARCVQLLYVQSQLAGHRPLNSSDRTMMTSALSDLIALSTGLTEAIDNTSPSGDTIHHANPAQE